MIRSAIRGYCLLLCGYLGGCCPYPTLCEVVSEKMEVVEAASPFPRRNRTSTSDNPVVAILHRGDRFYVCKRDYEKDYMYWKVKLLDGRKGYVIAYGPTEPDFHRIEGGQ